MGSPKSLLSGAATGAALSLLLLTGCATRHEVALRAPAYPPPPGPPPPDYVDTEFPVPDDYVYYPAYQVYYSNYRREYVYLERGNWISSSTPPRILKGKTLSSTPSVRLGFNDSPSLHHAEVIEQYPKDWAQEGDLRAGADDGKLTNGAGQK